MAITSGELRKHRTLRKVRGRDLDRVGLLWVQAAIAVIAVIAVVIMHIF